MVLENWTDMQKNETGSFSYRYRKINSKWMKDLNVRPETIKILEKKTDSNLFDLGHSNILQDTYLGDLWVAQWFSTCLQPRA